MSRDRLARHYLSQLLETMCYLHDMQVIHRDLKPENVVLDVNKNTKLIDFGTCKILNPQLISQEAHQRIACVRNLREDDQPERASFVGSSKYLSPEALASEYYYASDVWSFGIIAYYFYHSKLPFEGGNNYEIFIAIKSTEAEISESVPEAAQQLIR